jgi:diketogulonate reductase-like aldo/keto reductase
MEQQLKMIIMRNKMKEAEKQREESFISRKMTTDKQSEVRTIQSRKSSKQRVRVDEE